MDERLAEGRLLSAFAMLHPVRHSLVAKMGVPLRCARLEVAKDLADNCERDACVDGVARSRVSEIVPEPYTCAGLCPGLGRRFPRSRCPCGTVETGLDRRTRACAHVGASPLMRDFAERFVNEHVRVRLKPGSHYKYPQLLRTSAVRGAMRSSGGSTSRAQRRIALDLRASDRASCSPTGFCGWFHARGCLIGRARNGP